jgi:PAS domain S-box-containing protein
MTTDAPDLLQRTVLLVDDSPEDRFAYRRHLGRDASVAYTFLEAGTLEEGLELYRAAHPDCVLLDYSLPESTGLDWLDAAREDDEGPLPVVLITGTGDERVAAQAIQRGAADYLIKGQITPSGLSHTVGQAIQRVAADRELRALRRQAADRTRRDLRETEDRYLQLVENLPDAVLLLQEGRVVYANAVAGRMLGSATAADLLGQQLTPHVLPNDRPVVRALIDQAMLGSAAPATELEVRSATRTARVEAYVTPVQASGQPAVQVVLRDVTGLVQALDEAHAAGRAKAAFLSAVSQDVRTPLSAMVGTAQLMQRDVDRPKAIARHASRIERAAERLHRTFSDVIAFTSLELDRADLSPEPLDLADEAVAALERVRERGEARGITFEIGRTMHGLVYADPSGIRRCLGALFDHALAADGASRVGLRVEGAGDQLQVCVTHDGEALSPEARAVVDDPFDKEDVRTLGLPLAVRLAQAMGGTLELDEPGEQGPSSILAFPPYALNGGGGGVPSESTSALA